ncbi:MAG: L-aspartate oxidase [Bacteroidetes bacterium]|nr:MAG: L-aspartate oxidase [Bacteroidota bacterium]
MKEVDFLVIGSGIAGLCYAIKVAEHFDSEGKDVKICMLSKVIEDETSTKYAQGGIAGVFDNSKDSFEKHIEDTILCGDGLSDISVVEMVIKEGPRIIQDIIKWGTNFDLGEDGEYDLAKEGGHSESRIVHHKDITGKEIERSLLSKASKFASIEILSHYFAVDLITQHHLGKAIERNVGEIECFGVYALNRRDNKVITILSKCTLLAAGGAGNIYSNTTNPSIATGDGVAMAYRAKADISNMEFFQFHPTSLYNPDERPSFLISEAVRGMGGILKDRDGKDFMHKYDERGSLAPRDITARAIDSELKKFGGSHLYLDVSHLDYDRFIEHFPNITNKCSSLGIDIKDQMIPIVPAAHYMCGGIVVDKDGKTTIKGLYACGECSSTGLHGANRLASNSLLEALVYANRSYLASINDVNKEHKVDVPEWNIEGTGHPEEWVVIEHAIRELQSIMSNYVGIVRTNTRLNKARIRLEVLYEEMVQEFKSYKPSIRVLELRNMINVAHLVIEQALLRKENRGLHYSLDNEG